MKTHIHGEFYGTVLVTDGPRRKRHHCISELRPFIGQTISWIDRQGRRPVQCWGVVENFDYSRQTLLLAIPIRNTRVVSVRKLVPLEYQLTRPGSHDTARMKVLGIVTRLLDRFYGKEGQKP